MVGWAISESMHQEDATGDLISPAPANTTYSFDVCGPFSCHTGKDSSFAEPNICGHFLWRDYDILVHTTFVFSQAPVFYFCF
jgi:hypothetical protein